MAESDQPKTLAEQWSLPEEAKQPAAVVPAEKPTEEKKSAEATAADVVEAATNESGEETATAEVTTVVPVADETAPAEESTETTEQEGEQEEEEEKPEIKIETAPADFRFPTTNQTRHCFTRYIEYHRCIAAKGEDAPECEKFAKYYRSLCPSEWVERWNEQRENGTFPGPL